MGQASAEMASVLAEVPQYEAEPAVQMRGKRGKKAWEPNEKSPSVRTGFSQKNRRRPTLPREAVPSALQGLTTLFGMGRGDHLGNSRRKTMKQQRPFGPALKNLFKINL